MPGGGCWSGSAATWLRSAVRHDASVTIPPPVLTLSQILDTFNLEQVNAEFFVGIQIDEMDHHIVGGHIAAQALMAASRTASERSPHSMHIYFLRRGDARHPVDFEVTALHDGGTFSARRVTARQFGAVLLEGIASFSASVESHVYQQQSSDLPEPASFPTMAEQLSGYADERAGWWVREQPVEMRYIDPPARLALDSAEPPPARIRIWWRPTGSPPTDPILASCLAVYVSGRTLLEPAMIAHRHHSTGTGQLGVDGPCGVVSPAAGSVGLAALRTAFTQWHRRSRVGAGHHVQPHRSVGVHHDAGRATSAADRTASEIV